MSTKRMELVFIVDKSGSMSGLEEDTIGGFNSMIKKQKDADIVAKVTTVLFDEGYHLIHNRVSLNKIKKLTKEEYFTGGCTALYDAIGKTMSGLEEVIGIYDKNVKVMFVIITDGMENSSKNYSLSQIRSMIDREQEKHNWEFVFLGANIDAIAEAGNIGIRSERAAKYTNDGKGIERNFECLGALSERLYNGEVVNGEWKESIEEYEKERK